MYKSTIICPNISIEEIIVQQAQNRIPRSKSKLYKNAIRRPPIIKSKINQKTVLEFYSNPLKKDGGNHPFDVEQRNKILSFIKSSQTPVSTFTIVWETGLPFCTVYYKLKHLVFRGKIICIPQTTEAKRPTTSNYFTAL
jgi:hypothetical protein